MLPSSRTPEGEPGVCPVCQRAVVVELAASFGDAPCPACGSLLWCIELPSATHFFAAATDLPADASPTDKAAALLGVTADGLRDNPALLGKLGLDSIEALEVMLTFDDGLGR